ncbi:hypothetical protein E4U26_005132 [Claviceps purpurea]|nr:hypothetical protein E4U26_005132 [Claviceps purpurea]
MPRMSTHAPGRKPENTPGQDPSPSGSLTVHPATSIDLQWSDGQGFGDRFAQAEAVIAMARADATEAEARASAAMHNPQPTLNLDTVDNQPGDPVYSAETWGDQGFPQNVCTIASDLEVAAGAVYQVYIGEFEPLNLLRLDPTLGCRDGSGQCCWEVIRMSWVKTYLLDWAEGSDIAPGLLRGRL